MVEASQPESQRQGSSAITQVDANTRVDTGPYEGGFPNVAQIAGRAATGFDAYAIPSYEPSVQVADLTLKGGGTLATSPNRVLDVESDRRDPGLDALINSAYPNGVPEGAVLGYRDKNGPYFKVFQNGGIELHDPWASGSLGDASYDAAESRRLSNDSARAVNIASQSEASQSLDAAPDRMAQVLGYANSYPALARQIDGYGALIASGAMTPEQARDQLFASPRASMTLRSDYETPVGSDPSAPQMRAWDGASGDRYSQTRQGMEKGLIIPQVTAPLVPMLVEAGAILGSAAHSLVGVGISQQLGLKVATDLTAKATVGPIVGGAGFATSLYHVGAGENATPAGYVAAAGAGAVAGLTKYGLNYAAELPNMLIPLTYPNAATAATAYSFGYGTVGWLNGPPAPTSLFVSGFNSATTLGQSWWTNSTGSAVHGDSPRDR